MSQFKSPDGPYSSYNQLQPHFRRIKHFSLRPGIGIRDVFPELALIHPIIFSRSPVHDRPSGANDAELRRKRRRYNPEVRA